MRAVILVLILAVVALIIAVQTGFLDIRQTRGAEAPDFNASANGVTATGGQTPTFDVETGKVAVGTRPQNVTVAGADDRSSGARRPTRRRPPTPPSDGCHDNRAAPR